MAAWWFFWGASSTLSQETIGRRGILKVLENPWTEFPLADCCSHFPLPQSPLPCQGLASESTFPSLLLSSSAESLEAAGAAAQRRFMRVFGQQAPAIHIQMSHRSSADKRREGNTEHSCGSVCWSLICAKFANNSPREDYGGVFPSGD